MLEVINMKLRLQIASLGLLSLLAVPAATHTMAGRMVGTFVGTGGALASYWAVQNSDRIGSAFTRGSQLAAQEIIAEPVAKAIEANLVKSGSQLAGSVLRQTEKTLNVAATIIDSKIFTTALVLGGGYLAYNKIQKLLAGNAAVQQSVEHLKGKANVILEKLTQYAGEIKGWITQDGMKTRADIKSLEETTLQGLGVLASEVTKFDAKTQQSLLHIYNNLDALKMTQQEFKHLLTLNQETLTQAIANLEKANKEEFRLIRESQERTEKAVQDLKSGQLTAQQTLEELKESIAIVSGFLGASKRSNLTDQIRAAFQSAPSAGHNIV